jgi:amino acid transporter
LYTYAHSSLPPVFGVVTAWALFFAYVMTASSVIGGFVSYAEVFLTHFLPGIARHVPTAALAGVAAGAATGIAYRDVKLSARLMLWTEAVSVCLIAFVVAIILWKHGLHVDRSQIELRGVTAQQVRLAVMLAVFSFVGFESATTLGAEAREPLKTIPRAVIRSAVLAGAFFVVCAYGEVVGFHGSPVSLGESSAPFDYLSRQAGVGGTGWFIDAGVLISMFAATLACVIAASRVLLLMAHQGLAHGSMKSTHARNETPAKGSVVTGLLAFLPAGALALRGVAGADIYGYMGTLAVFGFLSAYTLACVALAAHLRREGRLTKGKLLLSVAASLTMVGGLLGNLFPVPPAPYRYFPYLYAAYLGVALIWYGVDRKNATAGA